MCVMTLEIICSLSYNGSELTLMASSKKIMRNYETPKHGQASKSSARMNLV